MSERPSIIARLLDGVKQLSSGSRGLGWVWWSVLNIALPSSIVFGLGAGSYLLFTRVLLDNPPATSNDSYKDVLQTVLAIAAIAVAAFGLGAYRLLSQQIEEKVARNAERRLIIANAIHKIDLGLLFWHFSKRSTDNADRLAYLEEAIAITRDAYDNEVAGVSDEDREMGKLVIQIRNNWAYYIYERDIATSPQGVGQEERKRALAFADYLDARKAAYSDMTGDLLDTVDKVRGRFGSSS